jgi:hypothetical protein
MIFTLVLMRFKFVRVEQYISDLISHIEYRADDAKHSRASQKDDTGLNLLDLMKLLIYSQMLLW